MNGLLLSATVPTLRTLIRTVFHDTLAVDMLVRGVSPYDEAKILGYSVDTVEQHYAPFVPALRERVRRIMENGEGPEETSGTVWPHAPAQEGKPN